ncbi:MAG TPA: hypothetical protein VE650_18405 [Acetobacteraceae bacterium]|nr:hypothetical protein [Acetobacteraceae bacterium]
MLSRRLLLIGLTAAVPASAQAPDRASLAEHAARRYPQPVRVGDLIGREVLEPKESQTVLGRVAAIRRAQDGGIDLVMRYGGLLGFGTRLISVPIEAVALLGEYVAMVGLTPDQLAALPTAPEQGTALGPDETIRVGLVRPFH